MLGQWGCCLIFLPIPKNKQWSSVTMVRFLHGKMGAMKSVRGFSGILWDNKREKIGETYSIWGRGPTTLLSWWLFQACLGRLLTLQWTKSKQLVSVVVSGGSTPEPSIWAPSAGAVGVPLVFKLERKCADGSVCIAQQGVHGCGDTEVCI